MNDTCPPASPESHLNLLLSSERHPGPAWPARGWWCGLRVKGPTAYVADCTPVDKALRCCCGHTQPLSPRQAHVRWQNTDPPPPPPSTPSFHTIPHFSDGASFIHRLLSLSFSLADASPVALFVTPSHSSDSTWHVQLTWRHGLTILYSNNELHHIKCWVSFKTIYAKWNEFGGKNFCQDFS